MWFNPLEVNYWRCTLASNTNEAVTRAEFGVFLVQVGFEKLQHFVHLKTNGADTVPANKRNCIYNSKHFMTNALDEAPPTTYIWP